MQSSIPEIEDLSGETAATMKLYGMDNKVKENFGRMCLMARRFAEEGVRFIQVTQTTTRSSGITPISNAITRRTP
ncbi:MAG: hypothetical protein Ct9H300mP1_34100 [Planctomycetaceae bacterium]|nr:MAG: hypothetical protein Ct9H300mP1_34100 [Planctomycetaceae bacterium]